MQVHNTLGNGFQEVRSIKEPIEMTHKGLYMKEKKKCRYNLVFLQLLNISTFGMYQSCASFNQKNPVLTTSPTPHQSVIHKK